MIIRDRTSCIACHAQESHRGVWNHNCSVPNLGTIVQLNPTSILPVIFNLRKADDAVPDVTHQEFFSVWQDGIPNDRCFAFLASAGARHNSPPLSCLEFWEINVSILYGSPERRPSLGDAAKVVQSSKEVAFTCADREIPVRSCFGSP